MGVLYQEESAKKWGISSLQPRSDKWTYFFHRLRREFMEKKRVVFIKAYAKAKRGERRRDEDYAMRIICGAAEEEEESQLNLVIFTAAVPEASKNRGGLAANQSNDVIISPNIRPSAPFFNEWRQR